MSRNELIAALLKDQAEHPEDCDVRYLNHGDGWAGSAWWQTLSNIEARDFSQIDKNSVRYLELFIETPKDKK